MLLFADISSHNPVTSWSAFLASIDGLICKVSEGTGYAWPGLGNALTQARNAGKCVGAYHYAGASGQPLGNPVTEADYFLSKYPWRSGEVPILDYEPQVVPADPDGWVSAWLGRVQSRLGVMPMVYMNHYAATGQSGWAKTRALNPGLWYAWYGANTGAPLSGAPGVAPWPGYAMWQYTSNGSRPGVSGVVDLSQFYGDAAAWRAYGTPGGGDMPLNDDDKAFIKDQVTSIFRSEGASGAGDAPLMLTRGYQAALDNAVTKVTAAVSGVTAPEVDEAKLAAALLADPKNVDALGAAIAAHLKLSSD